MELKELLKQAKKELQAKKDARKAAITSNKTEVKTAKVMPTKAKAFVSKFGCKNFDELVRINTASKKYSYLPKHELEMVKGLKEDVDVAILCSKILGCKVEETKFFQDELSVSLKAFGIDAGSEGFEWVPTAVSESYIEEYNLERKVSGLFMEVKMPTNPFKWPVLTSGAIARKLGVGTAAGKQTFKTDETIQFDAEKLANRFELPEELNEDSAPDIIKAIRNELIVGQEKALEIAILEGDTAATHMHTETQIPGQTGVPAADSCERIFDGFRKRLLNTTDGKINVGGTKVDETFLSKGRFAMGKFGVDPSQLAIISGVKTYGQMVMLNDVRTIEQYGSQATVLTGELAKYEGIPVIVSEYLREDTDATGVNGAIVADNNKGSVLFVNRKRWFVGMRRPIVVRVENNKTEYDVLDLVSFCRKAFQGVLKVDGSNYATESSAALLYNILLD